MSTNQHLLRHAWWDEPTSSDAWVPYVRLVAAIVVAGACIAGGFLAGKSWAESQAATPRMVVGHPTSVTLQEYMPSVRGQSYTPLATVRIGRGLALSRLIQQLNALHPLPSRFASSCPSGSADSDRPVVLRFGYEDGDGLTVRVDSTGCRFVSAPWFGVAGVSDTLLAEINRLLSIDREHRAT